MKRFNFTRTLLVLGLIIFLVAPAFGATPSTLKPNLWKAKQTFEGPAIFKDTVDVSGAVVVGGGGGGGSDVATGNVYYVSSVTGSNTLGNDYGLSWSKPWATVDYAIGQCTANNGDVIHVLNNHAESYTAANGFDADVAGITIVGHGTGSETPEFTFADTDATIAVGAAGVTFYNLSFRAGIAGIVMGISVEAAGDYFTMDSCNFPIPGTNSFDFLDSIDLATTVDGVTIVNCKYRDGTASASNHFIEAGTGTNPGLAIIGNDIQGRFAVSAIWSDAIDLGVLISGNVIANTITGQHCIEFTTTATGFIVGNDLYGDTEGSILDSGSMYTADNNISTAIDLDGIPQWVVDNGLNHLTALDGATNVYPENAATDSIIAKLMTKADPAVPSDFDNSTDSLQAIRDVIDTNNTADQVDLDAILADTITISGGTLPVEPTSGSLATFVSGGSVALGTPLAASKSLVDAIGTNGTTVADTATGVAGMIGVDDADNAMATTAIVPNADGSVYERLEYLAQMSEQALAAMRASGRSVGNVYYVDSVTGAGGDNGTTWALAEATIDAGISDCTSSKGDIVFVAPGHAEAIGAATIAVDVIGVTVIGLGTGSQMPTITFDDAVSTVAVTVAGTTLKNLRLYSTTINSTVAVSLAAGADYGVYDGLEFTDAGGFEFTDVFTLAAGADMNTFRNCTHYNTTAGGNAFISATAGAVSRLVVEGCNLWGDYTNAAIHSDQTNTNILIRDNVIRNLQTGDHAIQLVTGASTGYIQDNILAADTPGAILDPGSCLAFNNKIVESDITDAPDKAMMEDGWYYATATFELDGAANTDAVFNVTGTVEVKVFGSVTETLTSHGDTVSFGTADSLALLMATTAGSAPMTAGDTWTSATMAASAAGPSSYIVDDDNLSITQSGTNLADGTIVFHCYWRPLSVGASVVATP